MYLPPLKQRAFRHTRRAHPLAFDRWLNSEPGQALYLAEQEMIKAWLPGQVGQRAVALYCGQDLKLLNGAPLLWQTCLVPDGVEGEGVRMRADQLPLAKNSVDLLLIHHLLEFSDDPHRVLREAARSVKPGGKIAVLGFQPISPMGLARWFFWRNTPAWSSRYFSPNRVTDWLQVLGFEVDGLSCDFYTMPFSESARRKFTGLAWLWQRCLPRHGASYMLVARKRAGQVTPLTRRSREPMRPAVIPVPVARWGQQNRWGEKNREPGSLETD